jgi:hypothetical protein
MASSWGWLATSCHDAQKSANWAASPVSEGSGNAISMRSNTPTSAARRSCAATSVRTRASSSESRTRVVPAMSTPLPTGLGVENTAGTVPPAALTRSTRRRL